MWPQPHREFDLWDDPGAERLVPVKKGKERIPRLHLSKAGEIRVPQNHIIESQNVLGRKGPSRLSCSNTPATGRNTFYHIRNHIHPVFGQLQGVQHLQGMGQLKGLDM